ncbi:hypothetical protein, partial [Enterococcus faecalis]|uniref:hypothetical protein n=1 Tax=Enterococcus faecalis TaxID=1351 RepID=UPI003D6BCD5D
IFFFPEKRLEKVGGVGEKRKGEKNPLLKEGRGTEWVGGFGKKRCGKSGKGEKKKRAGWGKKDKKEIRGR